MKFALVLISTLAAGLALGIAVRSRDVAGEPLAASSTVTNFLTNTIQVTVDAPATNVLVSGKEVFHWRQIASSDLKQYVANLRGVACPEQTVRDIVLAIVNKEFAPKFAAVRPRPQSYWQKRRQYFANVEQARQLTELEKQRRTLLKELLGYEVKDPDHRGYKPEGRDGFAFLSPERRAALGETLTRLREQQDQQMQLIRAELESAKSTAQFSEQQLAAKWRELEGETRAQLAKLLTKEELEQYDLRTSNAARSLRWTLSGFEPTPEEFREIFQLQQKLNEQFGESRSLGGVPENVDREKYDAAKGQILAQLKEKFGEQRAAEYQRSQNHEYQELIRSVDRYNLAPDVPNKAWSLREAAQAERSRILAQPGVALEQQKTQLDQLAAATRQQMIGLMGESAFQRYERWRGPNSWMKQLGNPVVVPAKN